MELLDRYLQAVRLFLPSSQQDDIVRELSENLISQVEDREEALGRPLSEEEQADILRRHGHPMVVAGKYLTQQHLIGPALISIYLFTLKIGLATALVVTVLIAIVGTILHGGPVQHAVEAFLAYPGRALFIFGWTTLVFAALEYAQAKLSFITKWDPRKLPKVVWAEHRISRANSLLEFIFSIACAAWFILIPGGPELLLGPAVAFLSLAPVWNLVFVPIIALTLASAALSLMNFIRPYWSSSRSLCRIAIHSGALFLSIVLFRAGEWVTAKSGITLPDGSSPDTFVSIVNTSFEIGIVVAMIISVVEVFREFRRWKSRRKQNSPSESTPASIAL